MKKISVLVAMLALTVFSVVPAFAYEIEVEEGDVTIENSLGIFDSIVQNCPASVTYGDENVSEQVVVDSQNAVIVVDGDGNQVALDQSLSQSGFSPEVSTDCTQEIAQVWWF